MLLFEVVRIGKARHMYYWGDPDGVNPDENVCHVSSEGGVPTPRSAKYIILIHELAITVENHFLVA